MNRQHRRRVGAGLGLVGGAAAVAAFAMLATSPTARADNDYAVVPVLPIPDDDTQHPLGSFGLPPLFSYSSWEQDASYTDLLGYQHDTDTGNYPIWDTVTFGTFTNTEFVDDNDDGDITSDPWESVGPDPDGSTFDHFSTGFGVDNYYELTPVSGDLVAKAAPSAGDALAMAPTGDGTVTDNVNDTLVFDPGGLGANDSGIDFGLQYLYLPDAVTPVDELNILGFGGDVWFSIPLFGLQLLS